MAKNTKQSREDQIKELETQLTATTKALDDFQKYEHEVKTVQYREKADRAGAVVNEDREYGSYGVSTLKGYGVLAKAYELTLGAEVNNELKEAIQKNAEVFSPEQINPKAIIADDDPKRIEKLEKFEKNKDKSKTQIEQSSKIKAKQSSDASAQITEFNQSFARMSEALSGLETQASSIMLTKYRTINEKNKNYSKDKVTSETTRLLSEIESKGVAFSNAGHQGDAAHFTLAKYTKENGKYYKTEYNAGYASESVGLKTVKFKSQRGDQKATTSRRDQVYGVVKKEISAKNIEKVIRRDLDREYRTNPKSIKQTIDRAIKDESIEFKVGSTIKESKIVASQKLGNCTTRGIREMLRDNIPPSHFHNMYDMVTKDSYSDIKTSLQYKQAELSAKLKELNPNNKTLADKTTKTTDASKSFQELLAVKVNQKLGIPDHYPSFVNNETEIKAILNKVPQFKLEAIENNPKLKEFLVDRVADSLISNNIYYKKDVKHKGNTYVTVEGDLDNLVGIPSLIPPIKEGHTEVTRDFIIQTAANAFVSNTDKPKPKTLAERLDSLVHHPKKSFASNNGAEAKVSEILTETLGKSVDNGLITTDNIKPVSKHLNKILNKHCASINKPNLSLEEMESKKTIIKAELEKAILNDKTIDSQVKQQVRSQIKSHEPEISVKKAHFSSVTKEIGAKIAPKDGADKPRWKIGVRPGVIPKPPPAPALNKQDMAELSATKKIHFQNKTKAKDASTHKPKSQKITKSHHTR